MLKRAMDGDSETSVLVLAQKVVIGWPSGKPFASLELSFLLCKLSEGSGALSWFLWSFWLGLLSRPDTFHGDGHSGRCVAVVVSSHS